MNIVQLEDCKNIGKLDYIEWNKLKDASILITGSTGLIGTNLVNAIAYNNREKQLNVKLILLVRNIEMAKKQFDWTDANIVYYELGSSLSLDFSVDYIIHLASPTNSKYFTEKPVDTMVSNILGYKALLDWAKKYSVKKFIAVSSMEVYGFPEQGHKVREQEIGSFDTMSTRNSYPISKIACEALCNSYYIQFGVPVVILRATQTFGPGVKYYDGRVFAEFMRCVIENKDIVLKSKGFTERSYVYTADIVSAIIISLLRATPGEAYTVANPSTYCSISDMANLVADDIAGGCIDVKYDVSNDMSLLGYASTLYMDLDIEKIKSLGWSPTTGLREMFERMIRGYIDE